MRRPAATPVFSTGFTRVPDADKIARIMGISDEMARKVVCVLKGDLAPEAVSAEAAQYVADSKAANGRRPLQSDLAFIAVNTLCGTKGAQRWAVGRKSFSFLERDDLTLPTLVVVRGVVVLSRTTTVHETMRKEG